MNRIIAMRACAAAVGCLICALSVQCTGEVCTDSQDCEPARASSLLSSQAMAQPEPTGAGDSAEIGVVACTDATTGVSTACGAGLGCCLTPTLSCATFEACAAANGGNPMQATFHECDGPEDCAAGEQCWQEKAGTMCAAAGGYTMRCHSSRDCPAESPVCSETRTCVPRTPS